jgi:hypothetical protein
MGRSPLPADGGFLAANGGGPHRAARGVAADGTDPTARAGGRRSPANGGAGRRRAEADDSHRPGSPPAADAGRASERRPFPLSLQPPLDASRERSDHPLSPGPRAPPECHGGGAARAAGRPPAHVGQEGQAHRQRILQAA